MRHASHILGAEGELAKAMPKFQVRSRQVKLAEDMQSAMENGRWQLIEVETGSGKTLAYLAAAIASGKRVVIATATRALQRQIMGELELLAFESASLLQGTRHYPCLLDVTQVPGAAMSQRWCMADSCPHAQSCFAMEARRDASNSQIVVTNHSLYLQALSSDSLEQRLGPHDVVIFDEAHRLLDSLRPFRSLVLEAASADMATAVAAQRPVGSPAWLAEIRAQYHGWFQSFIALGGRSKARPFLLTSMAGYVAEYGSPGLERLGVLVERALTDDTIEVDGSKVYSWTERNTRVGSQLQRNVRSAHFLSGTLRFAGTFDMAKDALGLTSLPVETVALPPAYNYGDRTILYMPALPVRADLPAPKDTAAEIWRLTQLVGGKALVLFSSFERLEQVQKHLPTSQVPVIAQRVGESLSMDKLSEHANAIVLATGAYWNGVDLGDDLRLVAIDRLPFASHVEPSMAKWLAVIEASGRDPFSDYQLPMASFRLRQGLGRLVRSDDSYGVLAILDPRVIKRNYSAELMSVLPKGLPRTSVFNQVATFWQALTEEMIQ